MEIVGKIYNSQCLKCDTINKEMVKVGPMIFCNNCFTVEFVDTKVYKVRKKEVPTKSKRYKDWLYAYKKYISREF